MGIRHPYATKTELYRTSLKFTDMDKEQKAAEHSIISKGGHMAMEYYKLKRQRGRALDIAAAISCKGVMIDVAWIHD